jgi:N-acetylglucosaminyl-diphospho-decaprenol L-rhamnosyltransferase
VSDSLSAKVSVVIVVHNSLPTLRECLRALAGSAVSTELEVICVDNASTDDSVSVVNGFFPKAMLVRNDRNAGFAAACNQGASQAHGSFLLFLNPDVIVDPGAVTRLTDKCESDTRAGLVSGRLRNPDGTFQATSRRLPTLGNLVFSRGSIVSRFMTDTGTDRQRYTLPDCIEVTQVPAVAATMVMVRKTVYEQAGGFDSRFFMFMEDTDLSLRLSQSGHHNLFVPDAGGIHHWGAGSTAGRARRIWYHHLSVWKYYRKHRTNALSMIGLPLLLGGNLLLSLLLRSRRVGQ